MPRLFIEAVKLLTLVSVAHSGQPADVRDRRKLRTDHNSPLKAWILPTRRAPTTSQYNPLWARGAWIDSPNVATNDHLRPRLMEWTHSPL
jgi:hypothetical protein